MPFTETADPKFIMTASDTVLENLMVTQLVNLTREAEIHHRVHISPAMTPSSVHKLICRFFKLSLNIFLPFMPRLLVGSSLELGINL